MIHYVVCICAAADGQHVYLHAINARCLLDKYGAWENCPTTISAPVAYMEGFSMTEVCSDCEILSCVVVIAQYSGYLIFYSICMRSLMFNVATY